MIHITMSVAIFIIYTYLHILIKFIWTQRADAEVSCEPWPAAGGQEMTDPVQNSMLLNAGLQHHVDELKPIKNQ